VRQVYAHFGATAQFGMSEVLDLLKERTELGAVNAGLERNAGYLKSLREDNR